MKPLLLTPAEAEACRALIARHSKSFFLASRLLPEPTRQAAWALYAFCRVADDAIDEGEAGAALQRRVEGLRARLDRVYRGEAHDDLVDRAFARFVEVHGVPKALPEALLAGFEMDAAQRRYETQADLLEYAFCVASTVGLMMCCAMGVRERVGYLRAADLGVAMQLTNIARDLGEDARMGRCYVPRALAEEVDFDADALAAGGGVTPGARRAVRRLREWAEAHYAAGERGIVLLPPACRPAIAGARHLYAGIGAQLARQGDDGLSRRAVVPLGRQWALLARAGLGAWRPSPAAQAHAPGPADALLRRFVARVGLPVDAPAPAAPAIAGWRDGARHREALRPGPGVPCLDANP